MELIDFNKGWLVHQIGVDNFKEVTLPHDAMIFEERNLSSVGGVNTGWIIANDYEYKKIFRLDDNLKDKILTLEFEGVYHNAEVYLNNELVMFRPYGYTNFYVDITDKINWNEDNILLVKAFNSDQPNSRWYSGTGIYRPCHLIVQEKKHIEINGVKIHTLSINPAMIEIKVKTNSSGILKISILDNDKEIVSKSIETNGEVILNQEIDNAKLWDIDNPYLYRCKVRFNEDEVIEEFGIRTIKVSPNNGFELNNNRTLLLGACIHHDNGILGARDYKEASYRKVRLLKENGYNAIRSAHNPISKSMLEACDHLGMLVMDEYVDMWYIHKTKNDYANYINELYKQDLKDLCDKDYNHPSVIMISLGNEVAETGQKKGIEFFKLMKEECKKIDPEKFITVGVNIFFNYLHSLGFGVYSDKKANNNSQAKVGSEFFNDLAGLTGASFMKTMAKLPGCDRKTRDCYKQMDIAGYNYGIKRYKKDVKKYPNRIIVGSETFCSDAYRFFEFAKNNPSLIGDFVWSGFDYLGEVGIGSWEYKDYASIFNHGLNWVSAGAGRLDLIGNPLGEALYTKVAFEKTNIPQIAVVPVSSTRKKHSPSSWKFSNAIPSWSWSGLEGKKAKVEVYSKAYLVELYLNDKLVGKKKFSKNCRFDFNIKYFDGTLTAISYDKFHNEIARNSLITAGEETKISIIPETNEVNKDEIIYVNINYTDLNGNFKPLERGIISIDIENGELLGFGNACPYNEIGYNSSISDTYYGRSLAIIKALGTGDITIKAKSDKYYSELTIKTK